MRLYDLEYERWMRDPRISEAVDNCELSTLYQWLWETMKNDYAHASGVLYDDKHSQAQKQEKESLRLKSPVMQRLLSLQRAQN